MFSTNPTLIPTTMDTIISIVNKTLPKELKIKKETTSFLTFLILSKPSLYKHKAIPTLSPQCSLLNNTHTTIIPYYEPLLYHTNLCFFYSHYILDLLFQPQKNTDTSAIAITQIVLEEEKPLTIFHNPYPSETFIQQPQKSLKNFIETYIDNFKETLSKIKNQEDIQNPAFYEIPTKEILQELFEQEKISKQMLNQIKKDILNQKKTKKQKENTNEK
mgnify:CR=1 FL=1